MPKVSVIVPVYNTEKYLPKCLDSLTAQTLSDIEIICINDCSTDNSLVLLQEYAKKDNRIKIIDFKENKGAAVARNTGIDAAMGEYIGFVDSDDFVDLDFYEKLYAKAIETSADVVKGAYKNAETGFVDETINERIKEDKNNFCSTYCSAIFRHNLIKNNGIKFPELRDMEDPVFAFQCALKANKVEIVENLYLMVTNREDSITHQKITLTRVKDKIAGLQQIFSFDKECKHPYVLAFWFVTVVLDSIYDNNEEIFLYVKKNLQDCYDKLKDNISCLSEIKMCNVSACKVFGDSEKNINLKIMKNMVEKHDIISFDIFDTLLLRPFLEPTDLFEFMAQKYGAKNFYKDRIMAEKAARLGLILKKNTKEDVTYDSIYSRLNGKYPWAKSLELDMEEQTLQANKEILEIYNYAKSLNKRIIVVSDMYLSSAFLIKVLEKKGYQGIEKLYVSSEVGYTKGSGRLFDFVLEDLNIKPERILHIGDNKDSDYEMPKKKGLSAFRYKPIKDSFLEQKKVLFFDVNNQENEFPLRLLTGVHELLFHQNWYDYSGWKRFSYYHGGILLYAFVNLIKWIVDVRGLTDLFFVARDGYLPQKAFQVLFDECNVKCHYIYASRILYKKYMNAEKDNEYEKYINSVPLRGTKIGIVDTCAGEFSAQRLIEKYLNHVESIGIYMSTFPNYQLNYINLTLLNHGKKLGFNWDLIETLLSSPEAPIEDINQGKIIYRTDLNESDKYYISIFKDLEEGAIGFIKDIKKIFGQYSNIATDFQLKDIFSYYKYLWKNLTPEEYLLLKSIQHPVDIEQKKYVCLLDKAV